MIRGRVDHASSLLAGSPRGGGGEYVLVVLGPIEARLTVQAARDLHLALGTTLTARDALAAAPIRQETA